MLECWADVCIIQRWIQFSFEIDADKCNPTIQWFEFLEQLHNSQLKFSIYTEYKRIKPPISLILFLLCTTTSMTHPANTIQYAMVCSKCHRNISNHIFLSIRSFFLIDRWAARVVSIYFHNGSSLLVSFYYCRTAHHLLIRHFANPITNEYCKEFCTLWLGLTL